MTIVSKDKKHIINFDYVTDIFIGSNEVSIKVNFSNSKGCELERYYSQKDASVAMEMLCDAISRMQVSLKCQRKSKYRPK